MKRQRDTASNQQGPAGDSLLRNGKRTVDSHLEPGFQQPEGGWGWVVCLTSMCCNGTVFGSINTFGILYVAMLDQYGGQDETIAFKTGKWMRIVCLVHVCLWCQVVSICLRIVRSLEMGVGAAGGGGGGELYLMLHCHHQNDRCFKVGHCNVSFFVKGQSHSMIHPWALISEDVMGGMKVSEGL